MHKVSQRDQLLPFNKIYLVLCDIKINNNIHEQQLILNKNSYPIINMIKRLENLFFKFPLWLNKITREFFQFFLFQNKFLYRIKKKYKKNTCNVRKPSFAKK